MKQSTLISVVAAGLLLAAGHAAAIPVRSGCDDIIRLEPVKVPESSTSAISSSDFSFFCGTTSYRHCKDRYLIVECEQEPSTEIDIPTNDGGSDVPSERVPDVASTLSLLGAALLGLMGFSRRLMAA